MKVFIKLTTFVICITGVIAVTIFMEILPDLVGMESLKHILQNMRLMRRKKVRIIE